MDGPWRVGSAVPYLGLWLESLLTCQKAHSQDSTDPAVVHIAVAVVGTLVSKRTAQ